ncbi:MAG: hypothetical protein LUD78_06725 [Clostridiales bacterium]|nr:hypothetical protein [Clostridiales bacterium]
MADKELRGMNRTELIEIIYALQQNERSLRAENDRLRRQLEDRLLRMEKAGSIAEAALSLNHVFEDAEAAAQQYLDSLQAMAEPQAPLPFPQAAGREQAEPQPGAVPGGDAPAQEGRRSPNTGLRFCTRWRETRSNSEPKGGRTDGKDR